MDQALADDVARCVAYMTRGGDTGDQIRGLQALMDSCAAAQAELMAQLKATAGYETDGASTLGSWARTQLRVTAADARRQVRDAATLDTLPILGEAARAGLVRAGHVAAFTWALGKVGRDVLDTALETSLVAVALAHDPGKVWELVRELHARVNSDALDDAYDQTTQQQDFRVIKVGDRYAVTGDLNPVTGAKLKTVLDSIAAPSGPGDDRTAAERRVQGLDDLLTSVLEHGLPSDQGIRPHTSIVVDADTLTAAQAQAQADAAAADRRAAGHLFARADRPGPTADNPKPALLHGHGPIGHMLLGYFTCQSDLTAFLTATENTDGAGGRRTADVLNVGRTRRLATLKQRRAIGLRQGGICAAPGCTHTHLEIHHVRWWSRGGPTNLDNLIGLCSRCHHLLHRDKLHLTGTFTTGYRFTNQHGRPLEPQPRRTGYTTAA